MARHALLSSTQRINQKRLNGNPRTMGMTRSQRGTEKHMPINGTSPQASIAHDGFCTLVSLRSGDSLLDEVNRHHFVVENGRHGCDETAVRHLMGNCRRPHQGLNLARLLAGRKLNVYGLRMGGD